MGADAMIEKLGLELPPAPQPQGVYKPMVISGNMAYLSGHGPFRNDGSMPTGRVGEDMTLEDGYAEARQTGLALLSTLRDSLGSLDKVKRVIKTLALVNSTNDFAQQPKVVNGCSDLFVEVFGPDNGVGARSAMAANVLPGNIPVEIEMIVELV
jgi:enamine deaminase RidA (YjgF/YER057c/UK114 family)